MTEEKTTTPTTITLPITTIKITITTTTATTIRIISKTRTTITTNRTACMRLPESMLLHLLQEVGMLGDNLCVTDASCIIPDHALLSARGVKGSDIWPRTAELLELICNQWPWCATDVVKKGTTRTGAQTRLPTRTTMLMDEFMCWEKEMTSKAQT